MKLLNSTKYRNDPVDPSESGTMDESIDVSFSKSSSIKIEPIEQSSCKTETMGSQVRPETSSSKTQNLDAIEPHDNDVLCGRGGNINNHPGNEMFRQIVETKKRAYVMARSKVEKRSIVSSIVKAVQEQNPPGRFLDKEKGTHVWKEVDEDRAISKTSQALRENGPKIRKEIETEHDAIRAEMRREEEARHRRVNYLPYEGYYYDNNYHTHKDYRHPHDSYGRGHNVCPHCASCANKCHPKNSHGNSQYYGNSNTQEHAFHKNTGTDDRNDRYPSAYTRYPRHNKEYRQSPPRRSSVDPMITSKTSSSYSKKCVDEKQNLQMNPIDWRPSVEGHQTSGLSKRWQGQNGARNGCNQSENAMMIDEVEDKWNVNYQQHEDSTDTRLSGSNRSLYHYIPQRRSNGQATCKDDPSNRRTVLRNMQQKRRENTEQIKQMDENNSTSQFASFARSLFSWDSNTVISNGIDQDSLVPCRSEIEGEGQEVELISIMDSMSLEDDVANPQRWSDKPILSQGSREMDHEIDWSSKVGGCHSWFIDNMGEIIKQEEENKIAPANSMELTGDSISGTEANSFRGSVGGASLCYVFD